MTQPATFDSLTVPRTGELTFRVTYGGQARVFPRAIEYEYSEEYLSPSDSWWFTLDRRELSKDDLAVLQPSAEVTVTLDGNTQSLGVLDEPSNSGSTSSGSVMRYEGRDWLSYAIDSQIDPQMRFVSSMTLLDLITEAYTPVGVDLVVADSISNRNVITGRVYGDRTSAKGKPLRHVVLGEEKPYPNEGLFAFTSRVSQRFGLWIRPYVDGSTISVSAPDFDQGPSYGICNALDSRAAKNNVESWHFSKSRRDQPSIIYASGFGGGGNFAKSRLRSGITNPVIDADNSKIIDAYPNVKLLTVDAVTAAFPPFAESKARPAFLYDPESHTQDQLDAFLRRELALRMRHALTARYEILGHKINGRAVCVDTIVSVLDQHSDWNGPLWVLGRRFHKSVKGGTRTTIECILPGSLRF